MRRWRVVPRCTWRPGLDGPDARPSQGLTGPWRTGDSGHAGGRDRSMASSGRSRCHTSSGISPENGAGTRRGRSALDLDRPPGSSSIIGTGRGCTNTVVAGSARSRHGSGRQGQRGVARWSVWSRRPTTCSCRVIAGRPGARFVSVRGARFVVSGSLHGSVHGSRSDMHGSLHGWSTSVCTVH